MTQVGLFLPTLLLTLPSISDKLALSCEPTCQKQSQPGHFHQIKNNLFMRRALHVSSCLSFFLRGYFLTTYEKWLPFGGGCQKIYLKWEKCHKNEKIVLSTFQNIFNFTVLFDFDSISVSWRRKWQPTPVFLPGESRGRGSLVGCRLWGHTESDTTEVTQQQQL